MALCIGTTWESFPTVRYGSTGSAIYLIQDILNSLSSFDVLDWQLGSLTGTYDHYTEYGVKQYQTMNGLTADGICGPKTWLKLMRGTHTDVYNQGLTSDLSKYHYKRVMYNKNRTNFYSDDCYRGYSNRVWYDRSARYAFDVD